MRPCSSHLWSIAPILLLVVRADVLEFSAPSEDGVTAPLGDQPSSDGLDPPPGTDHPTRNDMTLTSANIDAMPEEKLVPLQQSARERQSAANVSMIQVAETAGTASALSYIRSRLSAEEKFSLRLRQLLAQSSKGSNAMQQKLDSVRAQLDAAGRTQKQLLDTSVKKIAEEETEIARQRSRAEAAEMKLQNATRVLGILQRNVRFLRERSRTLLSHLANITHISKAMESQLAAAHSNTVVVDHQLEAAQRRASSQRRVPLEIEAQLRDVQAKEVTENVRLKASERKNGFLQQRFRVLNKRDQILQTENNLLRTKLRGEAANEARLRQELDRVKGILGQTQQSNAQLQSQYADSLQGVAVESAVSAPVMGSNGGAPRASSLMDLKRDSNGLTALMGSSRAHSSSPS